MKSIAVVLIVFGLVATGIGLYFVNQSKTTQVSVQAARETNVLSNIIDDCSYILIANCPDRMGGKPRLLFVPDEVDTILKAHASEQVLSYTEVVNPDTFTKLGRPVELPVKPAYTVADIITRISLASDIDERLLIIIFATQGSKVWNGGGSVSNPLGRKELSFTDQFAAVALELRQSFLDNTNLPPNSVTNAGENYPYDTKYVSTASKGLYSYLARTSSRADFKKYVSLLPSEPGSFTAVWSSIFPSAPKEHLY